MPNRSRDVMVAIARKLAAKDQGFNAILAKALANKPAAAPQTYDNDKRVEAFAESTPDLVVLIGYLSDASESGWRRLYLDWAFRSWLLLYGDDILHSHAFEDPGSPVSHAVAVWLKADAKVARGDARTHNPLQTDESRYLMGDFISANDAAGDAGQPGSGGLFTDVTSASCCQHRPATSTRFMIC